MDSPPLVSPILQTYSIWSPARVAALEGTNIWIRAFINITNIIS
jgi:hypothetical protein